MPEHHRDKAKIIHFFCDLRKKSSEGLSDDFTWGELGSSGMGRFRVGGSHKNAVGKREWL